MNFIPAEIEFFGVYAPPLLYAAFFAAIAMILTVWLLNRYRLSRFFMFPEGVMLSLTVIYTAILGTWVFPT